MDIATTPSLDKRDWIAGLEKGLAIIASFDDANPRQTASQAGQRCGITRTAARRYLLTLVHLGFVSSDGKLFWLTPRVLRLGQSYLAKCAHPLEKVKRADFPSEGRVNINQKDRAVQVEWRCSRIPSLHIWPPTLPCQCPDLRR